MATLASIRTRIKKVNDSIVPDSQLLRGILNDLTEYVAEGTEGTVVAITNKAAGGAIGTAAATVDVTNTFTVNQTTAGQTLTIPSPTASTVIRNSRVLNIGSAAFTMHGVIISAGGGMEYMWTGAAWKPVATSQFGALVAASAAVSGAISSSSATAGIGYAAGAGGTIAQDTSKTTAVTLDKVTGEITMFATGAINTMATATFTVNNTTIGANDTIHVTHKSGGTLGAYMVQAHSPIAATSFKITVMNITGGNLTEAPVLQFSIVKGAIA